MIIPQSELDKGYRKMVHVHTWGRKTCFLYLGTKDGIHTIITPKTRKIYITSNPLVYTLRNKPQK